MDKSGAFRTMTLFTPTSNFPSCELSAVERKVRNVKTAKTVTENAKTAFILFRNEFIRVVRLFK